MQVLIIANKLGIGGTERGVIYYASAYLELGAKVALYLTSKKFEIEDISFPMLKEALIFNTIEKYKNYSEAEQWHPNVIHIHANGVNYKQIDFFLKEYVDSALILESCNFPLISDYAAYVDIHLQYSYWCLWQFLYRKRQAKAKTGIPIVFPRLMITDHFYPPNGDSALDLRSELNIPKDAFVFGRVGQPFRDKWSPLIFRAFEKALRKRDKAYLLLVGLPRELEKYYLNAPHAVKKHIVLHSLTSDPERLRTIYQLMNVFLHVADQGESFGLVLVEAMLCGVPVISLFTPYRDNSQMEVIGYKQEGGMIVKNVPQLLAAMLSLMDEKKKYKELSQFVRQCVLSRFAKEVVKIKLKELLRQAAFIKSEKGKSRKKGISEGLSYRESKKEIRKQMRMLYGWKYILHLPMLALLARTKEPLHGKIVYLYRLLLGHIPLRVCWAALLRKFLKLGS